MGVKVRGQSVLLRFRRDDPADETALTKARRKSRFARRVKSEARPESLVGSRSELVLADRRFHCERRRQAPARHAAAATTAAELGWGAGAALTAKKAAVAIDAPPVFASVMLRTLLVVLERGMS
jgi:hypothetical protein